MVEKQIEIAVLSPRGETKVIPHFPAAKRLKTLAGKKIAVLKFTGNWGLTEELLPLSQEILKGKAKGIQFREWSMAGSLKSREKRLSEIVDYADGVIVMLHGRDGSACNAGENGVEIVHFLALIERIEADLLMALNAVAIDRKSGAIRAPFRHRAQHRGEIGAKLGS